MLNYQTTGKASNQLIFIHGNSQNLSCWDALINNVSLSDQYSLITLDLPGHGNSFKSNDPQKDYSVKGMSLHVIDFLNAFNNQPYILIGNSLGTNIIGEIATTLINCKGIILTSSTALDHDSQITDLVWPNPNVAAFYMEHPTEDQLDRLIEDLAERLTADQQEYLKKTFLQTDPECRVQIGISAAEKKVANELQNIEKSGIPIGVVYGENDKFCKTDFLDKRPFKKWKNKTILLPGSGHCSQIDQPVLLANIIEAFAKDCFKTTR